MTPVEYEGTFWGDGNVLYFYGGDGYMTLYICQRSSLIHIKCVHFTICKLYHKTLVKNRKLKKKKFRKKYMLSSRNSLHTHKDRHTLIYPHPSCPPFPGRSNMPPLVHLSPCTRDCPGDSRPNLSDLASSSLLSSLPISPIPAPRKDVYTHTLSPFPPNLLTPLPPRWIS